MTKVFFYLGGGGSGGGQPFVMSLGDTDLFQVNGNSAPHLPSLNTVVLIMIPGQRRMNVHLFVFKPTGTTHYYTNAQL